MIDENKFLEQIKRTFDDSVLNEKRFDFGKNSLLELLEEMIKNLVCEIVPCSERLTNHFDYCGLFECKYYDKELAKSDKCKLFDVSRKKCHERAMYEKLIAYEDLEEQGLLLKLPCKVGDVAHQIMFIPKKEKCEIVEGIVEEIAYKHSVGFTAMRIKVRNADHTLSVWDDYDFGKYVFLTKAEAEAKLKEMDGK